VDNSATVRTLTLALAGALAASGQAPPDWRRVGNAAVELGLAGLATGPVERVWYADNGRGLNIHTALGLDFATADFETWEPLAGRTYVIPPAIPDLAPTSPEEGAVIRRAFGPTPRVYAFGRFVYRSDDGGRHWENLTGWREQSIIGGGLRDLAVSPANEDEIAVAGGAGVFRSLDGGRTWHGLNEGLPNLPGARLRGVPTGDTGVLLELGGGLVVEWQPGEREAWRLAGAAERDTALAEIVRRLQIGQQLATTVTAVAVRENYVYAGTADGRIAVSTDGQNTWTLSSIPQGGAVNAFWVDPSDPRFAIAALSAGQRTGNYVPARVVRTLNGVSWDDLSATLPETSVRGVTADRSSDAVYVATDLGVYWTRTPIDTLGATPQWTAVTGPGRTTDVRLDAGGNQLWVAVEGSGVYATLAPHRIGDPRVVSAADLVARAAAPGALLSVEGMRIDSAAAGGLQVPVLAATAAESQIQVPYEAAGTTLALAIDGSGGRRTLAPLALRPTAPAIFTDRDGTPALLDGDTGSRLDIMHPVHSRMRVQILATGLGRVRPDWPTAMPGPIENSPQVIAPVTAYLDNEPIRVTRAVLAPGLIGYYLVEVEIPPILNYGPAQLWIEAGAQASNRVRVYIEP
jgi:uncharacterized protein (TIGR03437 family)